MTITDGLRRLRNLEGELRASTAPRAITQAVLPAAEDAARRNASARPTPQARMAATALVVRGDVLEVNASSSVSGSGGTTSAGSIMGGSEYGSSIYRQFGPRRGGPAWFGRVATTPDSTITAAAERGLEALMDEALR